MPPTNLPTKLRIHTATRALALYAPDGYRALLGELPDGVTLDTAPDGAPYDWVHLFVLDRATLDARIDEALAAVAYDALLWISYPKGSSGVETDINRDSLADAVTRKGVRPVTQVSVDDTWSALRFRPADAVGKRG